MCILFVFGCFLFLSKHFQPSLVVASTKTPCFFSVFGMSGNWQKRPGSGISTLCGCSGETFLVRDDGMERDDGGGVGLTCILYRCICVFVM